MAENIVVNGVTYNGVDSIAMQNTEGQAVGFYPDAVRYNAQALTEAQKAQARKNIGAQAELTPADQEAIVQQVIAALGTPVFGRVDADNNIILTGELADGTYNLKYEDADGTVTEIGTLVQSPDAPNYTNWIPLATDASGNVLNGTGYQEGVRLSASSGTVSAIANPSAINATFLTGFIPIKQGDIIRLKNCWIDPAENIGDEGPYGHRTWALSVALFTSMSNTAPDATAPWNSVDDSSNVFVTATVANDGLIYEFKIKQNHKYMRVSLGGPDPSKAILTINEPIE